MLLIGFSGKKRSGKNTAANYIVASYLKRNGNIKDFKINKLGLLEARKNDHFFTIEEGEFNKYFNRDCGIKIYSFADYLKEFCIDVFSLASNQVYGTEEEKNSFTNLRWINMPTIYGTTLKNKPEYLTARELLQYFGTEICRKIDPECWVNATINKIKKENPKIAIITDCRFPNEVETINSVGGKTIRLLRNVMAKDEHSSETILDNYPKDKFSLVIDNRNMSIDEQCDFLKPHVDQWINSLYGK